jgi:exodeoxyribonuclease X
MRYIVFDTETTGVSKDKQAVEVALIEVDENLQPLGDVQALIRPTVEISPEAQAVHGITMEMLADRPTIDEWVEQEFGGLIEGDIVLIGHRVDFDKPLFAPIGNCVHTIDTLSFAYEHVPEAPNKKLDTLKQFLNLPGGGTAHRAMADALTCLQLLQYLQPLIGWSLHDMATTPFTVHYCPWGKHEGELLAKVPQHYRKWMLGLENLDPNLRRSLEELAVFDPPPRFTYNPTGKRTSRYLFPPRRTK